MTFIQYSRCDGFFISAERAVVVSVMFNHCSASRRRIRKCLSLIFSSYPASAATRSRWMSALPQVWAMPDLLYEDPATDVANDLQIKTKVEDQRPQNTAVNRHKATISLFGDEGERIELESLRSISERRQDSEESPQSGSAGDDILEEELQASNISQSMQPVSILESEVPRCWEHDCNGREFSTWSNLARHRREKSKNHIRSRCPLCGMSFSRKVVLVNHVRRRTCKRSRRESLERHCKGAGS
jgi:hypothetical protein